MEELKLSYKDIYLRDPIIEDIERYIRWNTIETEWQKWDAPWEESEKDELLIREKILKIIQREKPKVRTRLQLCLNNGIHIGAVSRYKKDGQEDKIAIGIDIFEKNMWGKGIGQQAFELWITYLFQADSIEEIYTETWSGNQRMVALAKKLGFVEVSREYNKRELNGNQYDGLAFMITKEAFNKKHNDIFKSINTKFKTQNL